MTYTKSTVLPVSPEDAFALLTEPERLRRWQTVSARVDLRAGGEYRWTVTPGHVAAGTFREVEPGRRVVLRLGLGGQPRPAARRLDRDRRPSSPPTAAPGSPSSTPGSPRSRPSATPRAGTTTSSDSRRSPSAATPARTQWSWLSRPRSTQLVVGRGDPGRAPAVSCATSPSRTSRSRPPARSSPATTSPSTSSARITGLRRDGRRHAPTRTGPLEHRVATMAAQAIEGWRRPGLDGMAARWRRIRPPCAAGVLPVEFLLHAWDFAQASGQESSGLRRGGRATSSRSPRRSSRAAAGARPFLPRSRRPRLPTPVRWSASRRTPAGHPL